MASPEALKQKALEIVARLKEVAQNERRYPSSIQAVLVLSGPGTYFERLKEGEQEWMRFMDRDRVRAGVAVVREITANTLSKKVQEITKEDILNFGPIFVYNGTQDENAALKKALNTNTCLLSKEKVFIIDKVKEPDGSIRFIRHTSDQINSLYQNLADPQNPLHGIRTLAIVAHIPDFIRILNYAGKYDKEFKKSGGQGLVFWVYALKSRQGTEDDHVAYEMPRLVKYAKAGHLAEKPSDFNI